VAFRSSTTSRRITAFGAAKRTIYIENQHVAHPLLLDLLIQALKRGHAPHRPLRQQRLLESF
jgi:hypothetical protein